MYEPRTGPDAFFVNLKEKNAMYINLKIKTGII